MHFATVCIGLVNFLEALMMPQDGFITVLECFGVVSNIVID